MENILKQLLLLLNMYRLILLTMQYNSYLHNAYIMQVL
jgi:hypothetical protein